MVPDADPRATTPTCVQEVGSKGTPRRCGEPARFGLLSPQKDRLIPMCEFHAWLAMDRAGYEISVEWPALDGDVDGS